MSENPPEDSELTKSAPPLPTSPIPETIGNYRIVRKLGEGGMGVVFEAQQQHPRRNVAVKVVRGGQFVDEHRVRMFQREADTLARLKHPNIGAVYESGRTEDGQHFFAMELIRGDTLDVYLKRRPQAVTPQEVKFRLRLLRKIADAVHYAHQRGVIHRDLKPSNIVVTEEASREDGSSTISGTRVPEAKILDFGLARITEGDVAATMATEVGVIKGTLPYMSPEQARGNPDEIDVRADVYALGVILYEMLAGSRPYDVLKKSPAEAVRVICEEPPLPLGKSWSGVRKPDADIETIVSKALEKEPERRYASAAALSEDLGRYLTSQPLLARPPSTTYLLKKLIARHHLAFGFGAVLLAMLVVFGVGMSVLFVRSVRSEAKAGEEAATAKGVSDFLVGLFAVSDPGESRGNTITAREVLDTGAAKIQQEMGDQPLVQARLMQTMGSVYRNLGLYDQARPLLEQALDSERRLQGEDHPDTLLAMHTLALLCQSQGDYDTAERLYRETLEKRRRVLGAEHRDTLHSMNNLGYLYNEQGRYEEAAKLHGKTLEIRRRVLGEGDLDTLWSMFNLAWVYEAQGNPSEAGELYRQTLDARERVLGEDHPDTLWSRQRLASVKLAQGDADEAERLHSETLDVRSRVQGGEHPDTLLSMVALGWVYKAQKRFEDAERLWVDALEAQRRVLGDDHLATLRTVDSLGWLYRIQGRYRDAEPLLLEGVDSRRRVLGDDHLETARAQMGLAVAYHLESRWAEAEPLLRAALDSRRRALGSGHDTSLMSAGTLAYCYEQQGRFDEAESLYREILEMRRRQMGETHPTTLGVLYALARVAALRGSLDNALHLLRQVIDHDSTTANKLRKDPSFESLHGSPEFEALLDDVKRRTEESR